MCFAFYFHGGIMDLKCSWVKFPGCHPPTLLCLQLPCFLLTSVLSKARNHAIFKVCFLRLTFSNGDDVIFPAQHMHFH